MRKVQLALVVAFSLLLLCGLNAFAANTYYIDCAGGSDSNNGTSSGTPWLHHPYMVGWTGSYSHAAGDQFYFKGGVTCPYTYFPLTVGAGGSSSAGYDYYGPDPSQTWHIGASWARPIWNLSGYTLSNGNQVFLVNGQDYVWADNFDVQGMASNDDNVTQHNTVFQVGYNGLHTKITNNYFHAWNVTSSTVDDIAFIYGNDSGDQSNVIIDSNYCNGADATPPSTSAGAGSTECIRYVAGGTITNNVMLNESNGIVFGGTPAGTSLVFTGNDCSKIWLSYWSSNHENCFEWQGGGTNNIIASNKVHDSQYGEAFFTEVGSSTSTDWIFNNICWNTTVTCYEFDAEFGSNPGYTAYLINNTFFGGSGYCAETSNRGVTIGTISVINNHCITTSGTDASSWCFSVGGQCDNVTNFTKTTNVAMTTSAATSQGYTSSEAFAYSPVLASNSTVGAGTNETSLVAGSATALAADTTYGCSVNAGNQLVCPARNTNARPGSGAWDAGAYQFVAIAPPPALGMFAWDWDEDVYEFGR